MGGRTGEGTADFLVAAIPFDLAAKHCGAGGFIALDNTRPIEFLLYLYFGKTADNLKNFALRDLGVLRINRETSFSARFTDADEANACFHYSQVLDRIEVRSVFERAAAAILDGPPRTTEYAADLAARAACQVGQFFEKQSDKDLADRLYRFGGSADCREGLVRLLYAKGDKEAAENLLRDMIADPESDDEHLFATDFYARKFGGRRTGLCTELLRSGRTIVVDDTHRGNPEAGVAGVLRLRRFAPQIDGKLAGVRSGNALAIVLRTVATRWGRPNGLFAWDHVQMGALRALLEGAGADGLIEIVRVMCDDFRGTRDSFPDLMHVRDGKVSFVEVKAEGDAIRRNQLIRLRQLENDGIPVEIGRVDYRLDPEQDYVVVDIETTGAWSSGDRITEIGAVKVRNDQVVDEWHSLVNPQRPIPAKIVELTGITNQMVRDARATRRQNPGLPEMLCDVCCPKM